jgi:hypothetical protein
MSPAQRPANAPQRRRSSRALVVSGSLLALLSVGGIASGFTNFDPPLSGATDFVTGAPTCTVSSENAGPIGLGFGGGHFFTTDHCNHTIYRFPVSAGDFSAPEASADNGLTHGIAIAGGQYYGLAGTNSTLARGLYAFDPVTLAIVGPLIAPFNDFGGPLAVVVDPASPDVSNPDLFVSRSDGIFRVQSPNSAPVVTQFAAGNFDGLCFTSDGSRLYGAEVGTQHVIGFDRSATQVLDVDLSNHGPDGIGVANDHTLAGGVDVSNNLFINSNDGTIERIDVNNGNAVSVVATGGSRGDFATVGPDGCFYATQTDRIVKLAPCFFATPPTTTSDDCGGGLAGAICLSARTISAPLCDNGTIGPKLRRFIMRKLRRDHALLERAARTTKPRVRRRVLKLVGSDLATIKRKTASAVGKGKLSVGCGQAIGEAIAIMQRVLVGVI